MTLRKQIESRDRAIKAWKKEELQYIEMEKEHLAKIEKMQQTISRQMDLRADATRELATLQQSIEDAPKGDWYRSTRIGEVIRPFNRAVPLKEGVKYALLELKDGE